MGLLPLLLLLLRLPLLLLLLPRLYQRRRVRAVPPALSQVIDRVRDDRVAHDLARALELATLGGPRLALLLFAPRDRAPACHAPTLIHDFPYAPALPHVRNFD